MKTTLKTLALALLGLSLAGAALPPARADLIKQSTVYQKTVLVTDSSGNNVTGLTTGSFTATVSKAGGAAASITTPTITPVGQGKYSIAIPAALTDTLGSLDITLTATGTVQTDSHDQVVAFDPASDLGAAALVGLGIGQTNLLNGQASLATGQTNLLNGQIGLANTQAAIKAKTDTITAFPTDYARNNAAPTWYVAPVAYPTDYAKAGVAPSWYTAPTTVDTSLLAKTADLSTLAKTADLAGLAKTSDLPSVAAFVTALKADAQWQKLFAYSAGKYTVSGNAVTFYGADDTTPTLVLTLTKDAAGNVTGRTHN